MAIRSLEALEKACENKNIYDVILEDDCMERGVTREESEKKMADLYAAIQHSAQNYTPTLRSASGMAGGDGAKMRSYVKAGKTICGEELGQVIAQALEIRFVDTAWKSGDTDMKCLVASGMAGLMDEIFDDLNEQCRKRLKEITIGTLDHRIFGNQNKER